jgi:hypothetical protein
MNSRFLTEFHRQSRDIDYLAPLESLLDEFSAGRFADSDRVLEDAAMVKHFGGLWFAWDRLFSDFPTTLRKRRSVMWEYERGRRDEHLLRLIAEYVREDQSRVPLIVNPATVFGRHAMRLARELPDYQVVGSDIDVKPHQLYRLIKSLKYPRLPNYRYEIENVFDANLERRPAAVTFFGACGVVTDGCMDYAIAVDSPFLICRSCCHECIGGNTDIVLRPSWMWVGFYAKNLSMKWIQRTFPGTGFYFSDRFQLDAYPRSKAAQEVLDSNTILDIAQNSYDSDICRSIIDLDRCLFLQENGYDVLYREELFFAHKRG